MEYYNAYMEWLRDFKGETVRLWMVEHLEVPVFVAVAYLIMVLWVPEHIMKDRRPLNLKFLNILWNLLLTVFAFTGAYYTLPMIWKTCFGGPYTVPYEERPDELEHRHGSLYMGLCEWNANLFYNHEVGAYVMLFILSKMPEMLDTAFLVFQKKGFIFLHWYHHVTVMLYCWHAYVHRIGSGLAFAGMNYGVHSVMYLYYFCCSIGLRRYVRPFAMYITILQIAQMVIGLFVESFTLYHLVYSGRGCASDKADGRLGLMMYLSYFILFSMMFAQNYGKKNKKADGRGEHKKVEAAESNGTEATKAATAATNNGTKNAKVKKNK